MKPTKPSTSCSDPTPTVKANEVTYVGAVESSIGFDKKDPHLVVQVEKHEVVVFSERLGNQHAHHLVGHIDSKEEQVS